MKVIVTLVLLLTVWGAPYSVNAEEEKNEGPEPMRLSLEECVKRAVASSHTLAANRHRLAALDSQMKQALWAPFSNIRAKVFGSMVPNRCVDTDRLEQEGVLVSCPGHDSIGAGETWDGDDGWGPTVRLSLEAGIPVYTFGKMKNGKRALDAARSAKEAEYPMFENKIRFQVMQAYHAVSGAREMLYTIDKGRKFLEKATKKVEKDLENQEGTSTEIDLIKLKVFKGEISQYETQAREIEQVGLAALRLLVGGDDRSRIDILDVPQEKVEIESKTLEAYKQVALDNRPELKAIRHAVEALEAKVKLRKSEFWPDLIFIGGIRYSYTPGRDDIQTWGISDSYNYGPAPYFGLVLDYRFDLGLDINKLKEAKAELAAITTDQKAALDGVMMEVEQAYHHTAASLEALQARLESKKLVKGWVTAAMQNQATGVGSAKEVKDALAEYLKVMAGIHMLTHDYNVSVAEMNRVVGVFGPIK